MRKTIGFIGCGNMGSALIGGMLQKGFAASDIIIADPDADKVHAAASRFGIRTAADNRSLAASADAIILAVKPQKLSDAAAGLSDIIPGKLLISILAGKRIDVIARSFGDSVLSVVRVMPNTPALVGEGMSVLSYAASVSADDRSFARSIFTAVGRVMELEERFMDIVTAVSGSGPAYLFAFIEAIMAAGEEHGLSSDAAKALAVQTFTGALKMLDTTGEHPSVLRKNVTSPNGTTEAALTAMASLHVADGIRAMIRAAKERSEELGR